MFQLHIRQPSFEKIKLGIKTLEGRLDYGIFKNIQPMDLISVVGRSDDLVIRVTEVYRFNSFADALASLPYFDAVPDATNATDAIRKYRAIYNSEKEKRLGVLFLKLEKP